MSTLEIIFLCWALVLNVLCVLLWILYFRALQENIRWREYYGRQGFSKTLALVALVAAGAFVCFHYRAGLQKLFK